MPRFLAFAALATACGLAASSAPADAADEPPLQRMTEDARKVAGDLVAQVRGELTKALEFSGPLRAIVVCKYSVPELSSAISRRTGWRVSRVALRPRNPALGMADAWEQQTLLDFERRVQRGENPAELEAAQIVTEPQGRYFRYMQALPAGPLCVSCHGAPETISEAIRATLAVEYPHDRALGTRAGQVRGAVTIKRPLSPP